MLFHFLHDILQSLKFEDVDLKNDNSFFKILSQKDPNEANLALHLGIFIFSQNFAVRQIRGY